MCILVNRRSNRPLLELHQEDSEFVTITEYKGRTVMRPVFLNDLRMDFYFDDSTSKPKSNRKIQLTMRFELFTHFRNALLKDIRDGGYILTGHN